MNIEKIFSKNLKIRRQKKKFSQEKLAELAGLDRTYISLVELNQRSPTLRVMGKLAKALACDVCALLKNESACGE
jgi:transcriptional regulator with XRE-family HTH domain